MRARLGVGAAIVAAIVGASATAGAEDFRANAEGSRVGLATDIWPTSGDSVFVLSTFDLNAQIGVHKNVGIDLSVPWAVFGGGGEKYAAFGNPTVGAHFVTKVVPDVAVHGGLSVSIPTRLDYSGFDGFEQVLFVAFAAASRAYYDAHRFLPETLSIRIPIGAEARFLSFLYYRIELNPVVWVPVGEQTSGISPEFILEHADEIEARAPFGLGGGLRFQFFFALTSGARSEGDHAQIAMEPFVGYEAPGDGLRFFGRLGLLIALDTPAGFGFDKGKLASIRVGGGVRF